MIEKITERIWSIPTYFKVAGLIQLNGRCTLIRLRNGRLWVHSPVRLTPELKAQIDPLGEVAYLVAPSLFHHLFVGEWKEAYPQAQVYAPQGLEKKRPDLEIDHFLSDHQTETQFEWSEEIDHVALYGMPKVREHLFYDRFSQTVIITDFCFFFPQAAGFTKYYLKLNGVYQVLNTPLLFRSVIKDKHRFRTALQKVKQWDVHRLSLCHHSVILHKDLMNEQGSQWSNLLDRF